jgi:hypothetical protein
VLSSPPKKNKLKRRLNLEALREKKWGGRVNDTKSRAWSPGKYGSLKYSNVEAK